MKEHLIEILYTGYKISHQLEELEEKGIQIDFNGIDNSCWDIVVNIIGFPKDNTSEIMKKHYKEKPESNDDPFMNNKEMFCRDWLMDDYFNRIEPLKKEQDMYFKNDLLHTKIRQDEKTIKNVLAEHIDWLKVEFEKYDAEK